jgi:DnaJ-class molecular chaperone
MKDSDVSTRRRSDTPQWIHCGRCNGNWWYREIWKEGLQQEKIKEVECPDCAGKGKAVV